MLNQSKVSNPTQQVLVPGGRQGKYIHDLQCTRSFESEPALRVTQGVAYMLVVPSWAQAWALTQCSTTLISTRRHKMTPI